VCAEYVFSPLEPYDELTCTGGAVAGGTFAGLWSLVWWPWTFWTFGIAMMVLAVLSMVILPEVPLSPEISGLTLRKKLAELDLLGALVGITAMILFNFAWNQAPGFGWDKIYIYVMLIVGVLLFPAFFWIELKFSEKPLIPFNAFSSDVSFVLVCEVCGWASFGMSWLTLGDRIRRIASLTLTGIFIYYFIQILQQLRGASPLLAMAYLSPAVISGFIAAITTGHVISRIGPGWVMLISMLAFLIGSTLVATMPVDQPYWNQAFILVLIIPWGMDMSFPAGTLIMSDAVEKKHQGMAASLVNTVVNYSISIGVGIAGTVETRVNPGGGTEKDELAGYRASLYLGIGLSGIGVLTSILFLGKMQLQKRRSEGRVQDDSAP
jgi:MFS family permease